MQLTSVQLSSLVCGCDKHLIRVAHPRYKCMLGTFSASPG